MPTWLGVVVAGCFALVATHRTVRRDAAGALMAAGMAVMSVGMGGVGPMFVQGPWWSLGFLGIAIWPLLATAPPLRRVPIIGAQHAGPVCGGPLSHLLGGVAMVYMCMVPMPGMGGHTSMTAHASELTASAGGHHAVAGHHAMAGHHTMAGHQAMAGRQMAAPMPALAESSSPYALLGWALAGYFFLGAVSAMTRRNAAGTVGVRRGGAVAEAVMGAGTVIMLVAMT
jgi:hypothetical protein